MPISFGDDDIWSAADGSFQFTPGMIQRRWMFKPMLRTDGEIPKRGGLGGCDHSLTLKFHAVEVAEIPAVFFNINSLARGLNSETLSVPDYGDYRHCVVTSVQASPQTAGLKDVSPSLDNLTRTYLMEFNITFRQTRP